MRTLLLALCLSAFVAPTSLIASPPDGYHVMWKTPKGKDKCCNKKSQEKADRCAEKMRTKGKAKGVSVMAGSCKNM